LPEAFPQGPAVRALVADALEPWHIGKSSGRGAFKAVNSGGLGAGPRIDLSSRLVSVAQGIERVRAGLPKPLVGCAHTIQRGAKKEHPSGA
jgi:hypothetical protein